MAMATSPAISVDSEYEIAFQRDWQRVFRLALASTNDIGAAEDLAQDSFARLWQNRNHMDWSRPVLPWLLVTTRRLATDRWRRLALILRTPNPVPMYDESVTARWLDLREAMAHLSQLERSALVLTAEGYGGDEIGVTLGVSGGAVRAAVSRARRKLEEIR